MRKTILWRGVRSLDLAFMFLYGPSRLIRNSGNHKSAGDDHHVQVA